MLRAPSFLLSIPLLFALASCGGAPPPNTGANATSEGKPGDSSTSSDSDKEKSDTGADGEAPEGADTGAAPDKKLEGNTRGPGGGSDGDKNGDGSAPPPPPPPQAASVVSNTPLSGRLTQQEIADILSKNAAYFNDCYTIGAGKGQEFRGTVTVKATLGPSGTVTVAEVIKSTAKNAKVDACVVTAFKKIKFPAPKDGGTSVITFPMEFQGVEQVK